LPPPAAPPQFDGLSLRLGTGRRILDNVCGDFPHSHLHAIMGPSGSGKSCFITALTGKASGGSIEGTVTVWRCKSQDDELGVPCLFRDVK
jgi:ABC-type multidrug transport system ATPase subunit